MTQYASTLTPIDVMLPLDEAIPLTPWWIFIYAMIYPAALLPLVVVKDPLLFRRLIMGYICLEASAMVVFVLAPVHMTIRPPIESITQEGFFPWAVQLCYFIDKPTCCFPSLHVAAATYSALCALRVDRFIGWCSMAVAILIAISTLTVKQHFIADVALGAVMASVWYWLWMRTAPSLNPDDEAYPRSRTWIPVGVFSAVVLVLYGTYISGWAPWQTGGLS